MIRSKIAMGFLWAWVALLLHLIPGAVAPVHAQGSRKDDIVFNSRGIPLAGATVRVCAMPASGQPCTPLALIYSDAALTQALANPTTTDGLGNYFFYAAPGKYEIEISGPAITTKQLPNVILPNDPASPNFSAVSAFSLNLSGNLTVNGNTTVIGNLASGTLNLSNQSTPPGAASSGTVNLYTKTADKRLYYKDDTGTEVGPVGAGAQTNVANNWTAQQNLNANTRFKGPNPYVDVTAYGVRDVNPNTTPAAVGLTANCTNGSATATISAASTFQNGDGVVLYGCGAAHSMTTPGAPTVTPSVARVMTGTGDVVNGPSGSTTYNYQIIARDKNGGLTAASAVGSTSVGAASLGSQSVALTSCSRANDVVTCVTSAAHGLTVGSMAYITGTSDNAFAGWYEVSSSADNTHFVLANLGLDTRNGATTSSTGGTVFWFNCNHLTWSAVTGAWEYYIYGRTGASLTLIGVSRPSDLFSDLTFDDFGSPMMDNVSLPPFVPSTPPSAATSDHLVTTIVSGAGTTTLTLAASAGTSVSGATIRFDNAPNILAAAANSAIYFPVPTNGGSYVVNSFLDLTATNPAVIAPGGLYLNETLQIGGGSKWYGEPMPQRGGSFQFDFNSKPAITVATANPGVYLRNASTTYMTNLVFNSAVSNGALLVVLDGGFNHTFDYVSFQTGSGSNDYMGIGLLMRGVFGNAAYSNHFKKVAFSGGPSQTNGASATPLFYCNDCGVTEIDSVFLTRRALLYRPDASGGFLNIGFGYEQGGITPFLTVAGNSSGGNSGGYLDLNHITEDTMAHPLVSYLPSVGSYSPAVRINIDIGPSSGVNFLTGNRFIGGTPFNAGGGQLGTNRDNAGMFTGTAFDGLFQSFNAAPGPYSNFKVNSALLSETSYPIFVNGAVPAQPTCSVSAGGSVPLGAHTYRIVPVWQNGAEGAYSLASATCTTTSGNQTVTVNWTTVPGNPKGYDIYQDNILVNSVGQCAPPLVPASAASFVFSSQVSCGNVAGNIPAGGPTMMMPGTQGMATPSITIGGGGVIAPPSTGFTATRTQTLPDVTGYIPVTSYVNSAYDNATRANGAIGSNWTIQQNGLNISSNQIQGTTASASNTAFWNANPFSPSQFAQATVAALNGASDFPGVTVLASGTSSSSTYYDCVENSTTIYIQRVINTGTTNLTNTASTGVVGDILRLEAAPGGALTCYKNGAVALTATDTQITAGSPGLLISGNVATEKNWSGGNLHPLAQLDAEQDWTRTQHFVQGIALGGVASESFNNNPRAEQNVFLPGALTATWTGSTWTTDKAVTVTRVQVQAKTAPAGCTTNAVVRLTDGTTPVNVTVSAAANDSGAISQNYAAGVSLQILVQTAAAGCTTSPADANVTVQYRMQ